MSKKMVTSTLVIYSVRAEGQVKAYRNDTMTVIGDTAKDTGNMSARFTEDAKYQIILEINSSQSTITNNVNENNTWIRKRINNEIYKLETYNPKPSFYIARFKLLAIALRLLEHHFEEGEIYNLNNDGR